MFLLEFICCLVCLFVPSITKEVGEFFVRYSSWKGRALAQDTISQILEWMKNNFYAEYLLLL